MCITHLLEASVLTHDWCALKKVCKTHHIFLQCSITDWSILPLLLGISEPEYERIISDNPLNVAHQHKAITKWLASGNASWAALVNALRDELVNEQRLADEIARTIYTTEK